MAASFALGALSCAVVSWLHSKRRPRRNKAPPDAGLGWVPSRASAPHPGWQPGEEQPAPFDSQDMLTLDPALMEPAALYPLVISAVVPRPVAFISSISAAGVGNLSPFSYFNCMLHNPPTMAVGITRTPLRADNRKDTFNNIQETGEFVINIISEWFVEAANHTCGNYDALVDEMTLAGLTPVPSLKVNPPRVKESAVQMECVVRHIHDIKDSTGRVTGSVVIGEVLAFHFHQGVLGQSPSGKVIVDPIKLQPISRLGGIMYGRSGGLFDMPRPDKDGHYPPPAAVVQAVRKEENRLH